MKRILIVVDVQNDFCPGGSLAVPDGRAIIPNINLLMARGNCDAVIATQDWHPSGHVSFAGTHNKKPFETVKTSYGDQTLWPDHCVQGTTGADFHPDLDVRPIRFIVRKGYRQDVDSYSGFFENDKTTDTGLRALVSGLIADDDGEVIVAGIATDVCVLATVLDAKRLLDLGYGNVLLPADACAGVTPEGTAAALEQLRGAGIAVVRTRDLAT